MSAENGSHTSNGPLGKEAPPISVNSAPRKRSRQDFFGRPSITRILLICCAAVVLICLLLIPQLRIGVGPARPPTCEDNLRQMKYIFDFFADEHKGRYPELKPEPGCLMFTSDPRDPSAVWPEYMTDASLLLCPEDTDYQRLRPKIHSDHQSTIDDHSYYYLGYAVSNEAEIAAFADAYRQRVSEGLRFDEDLPVSLGTGTGGQDKILRLEEGVERYIITDPYWTAPTAVWQADIPVLIERPENHVPMGGNVLYMDGHVEFIEYPGKWPMTEATIGTLESIDALSASR